MGGRMGKFNTGKNALQKKTFNSVTNVSNIMQGWSYFTNVIKQNMMKCIMAAILARMLSMSFIVG